MTDGIGSLLVKPDHQKKILVTTLLPEPPPGPPGCVSHDKGGAGGLVT